MPLNQYGQPQRVKQLKLLNVPDSLFKKIDTLTLYKSISFKLGDDMYEPKSNQISFIRFFSHGKLVYSHGNRVPLSKEYFRPSRGKQGSYFINKKNKLTYTIITSGEGHGYTYRGSLVIKGDSLIMDRGNNYIEYYKKINKLDKAWLDWQPDW